MKSKEEIEDIANKEYGEYSGYHKASFTSGYIQCQEDMVEKKYTKEDMLKCWNTAWTDAVSIDFETYEPTFYEDFIKTLNK
jgi:hypothetical protein